MPESGEKRKWWYLSKTQVIITIIIGVMTIVGTLYGLFNSYDSSLVHMTEYTAFKQQVNEATLQQRIDFYQRIVWDLETLHDTSDPLKMDHDTEKYRTAAKNLDVASKQLEDIQKKDNP